MKKIVLIIFIIFCIFQMIALAIDIDIGCPAIDRDYSWSGGATQVNIGNPANASGKITSIEIWASTNLTDVKVATFFVESGNNLSTRDSEVIGAVTAGAKRTFEVDLDVQEGDYLGMYHVTGAIEEDFSGGEGLWNKVSDEIPCENVLFSLAAGYVISLYGTGATVVGWEHKWNTLTISKWNTKEFTKWNGLE